MLQFDDSCYVDAKQYHLASFSTRNSTLNTALRKPIRMQDFIQLCDSTANTTATVNEFPIKQVSTVKSLGVHIDENLTWECHINELSKKTASGITAIKRIRYSVSYKTLLPSRIH